MSTIIGLLLVGVVVVVVFVLMNSVVSPLYLALVAIVLVTMIGSGFYRRGR